MAALPGASPVDPGLEADRGGLQRPRCLTTLPTMLLGRSAGFDRAAGVSELSEAADLTAWVVTIADVPVGRLVVVTAGRVGSGAPAPGHDAQHQVQRPAIGPSQGRIHGSGDPCKVLSTGLGVLNSIGNDGEGSRLGVERRDVRQRL